MNSSFLTIRNFIVIGIIGTLFIVAGKALLGNNKPAPAADSGM